MHASTVELQNTNSDSDSPVSQGCLGAVVNFFWTQLHLSHQFLVEYCRTKQRTNNYPHLRGYRQNVLRWLSFDRKKKQKLSESFITSHHSVCNFTSIYCWCKAGQPADYVIFNIFSDAQIFARACVCWNGHFTTADSKSRTEFLFAEDPTRKKLVAFSSGLFPATFATVLLRDNCQVCDYKHSLMLT